MGISGLQTEGSDPTPLACLSEDWRGNFTVCWLIKACVLIKLDTIAYGNISNFLLHSRHKTFNSVIIFLAALIRGKNTFLLLHYLNIFRLGLIMQPNETDVWVPEKPWQISGSLMC